jgi:hypothetical protein
MGAPVNHPNRSTSACAVEELVIVRPAVDNGATTRLADVPMRRSTFTDDVPAGAPAAAGVTVWYPGERLAVIVTFTTAADACGPATTTDPFA